MFDNMLRGGNIQVYLNTDYFSVKEYVPEHAQLVFTGPLDAFFGYRHGRLEYRQVRFERQVHPVPDWQGTSVVNYPEAHYPYTRICEPKHFYREKWAEYPPDCTVTFKEYSSGDDGENPFYPVNDDANNALAARYREEAEREDNLTLGGRLGSYRYYDMEDAIRAALETAEHLARKME
jgi:UDP-galactopyranose mutase